MIYFSLVVFSAQEGSNLGLNCSDGDELTGTISESNSFICCRNWKLYSLQSKRLKEEEDKIVFLIESCILTEACDTTLPLLRVSVWCKASLKIFLLPLVSTIFLRFCVPDLRSGFSFIEHLTPPIYYCIYYVKGCIVAMLNHGSLELDTQASWYFILSAEAGWFSLEICVQYLSSSQRWFPASLHWCRLLPLVILLMLLIPSLWSAHFWQFPSSLLQRFLSAKLFLTLFLAPNISSGLLTTCQYCSSVTFSAPLVWPFLPVFSNLIFLSYPSRLVVDIQVLLAKFNI